MKDRLLTAATVIFTAICLGALLAWYVSFYRSWSIRYTQNDGVTTLKVGVYEVGVVNFFRFDDVTPHFRHSPGWDWTMYPITGRWRLFGWFSWTSHTNDFGTTWVWLIPLWVVVLVTAILPWFWLWRRIPRLRERLDRAREETTDTGRSPS